MSIEFGIWRIDQGLQRLESSGIDYEARLEHLLAEDITLAAPGLMVIGRQVRTDHGTLIDILAIDKAGNLAVLELKRDKTYRNIVAQVLDYGAWVRSLRDDDIARIFEDYQTKSLKLQETRSNDQAFCDYFDVPSMPDELNDSHSLLIVAAHLDPATERIVEYLGEEYGLEINVAFFKFLRDEDREYLARAWLREPTAIADALSTGEQNLSASQWNGEYYVSFGHGKGRDWEDARKYGFVSGGGGAWYSNTLQLLDEGARIWANVPGIGYVGVGRVTGPRVPYNEFEVKQPDGALKLLSEVCDAYRERAERSQEDPEKTEYMVPVDWIATVPLEEAIKEKGFFGNQNTVAKPKTPKWDHTVERLKKRFRVAD